MRSEEKGRSLQDIYRERNRVGFHRERGQVDRQVVFGEWEIKKVQQENDWLLKNLNVNIYFIGIISFD